MAKTIGYIVCFLVILFGLTCVPNCVEFIKAKSEIHGEMGNVQYDEFGENALNAYSISYDLDGGVINGIYRTNYSIFTSDFTLPKPVKDGCEFVGWTSEDILEPNLNVVIKTGSTGNLQFTANYFIPYAVPVIKFDSTNNVFTIELDDRTESSTILLNDNIILENETTFDLDDYKNSLINGNNSVTVKALFEGTIEEKTYSFAYSDIYGVDANLYVVDLNEFNQSTLEQSYTSSYNNLKYTFTTALMTTENIALTTTITYTASSESYEFIVDYNGESSTLSQQDFYTELAKHKFMLDSEYYYTIDILASNHYFENLLQALISYRKSRTSGTEYDTVEITKYSDFAHCAWSEDYSINYPLNFKNVVKVYNSEDILSTDMFKSINLNIIIG